MATIQNQATLSYTYGTTTASAVSNLAVAERSAALTLEKRVLEDAYRKNGELTYVILLKNTSAAALTDVVVADDLGTFTPAGGDTPVTPLTYAGPAALYLNGAFVEELTPDATDDGVTFTVPQLPAGAIAMLLYKAQVNEHAPTEAGGSIQNTATSGEQSASAEIPVEEYADVTIEKEMAPNPITDGATMTVTFTIENAGNTEATDLVLTDAFPIALSDVAITVNGAPVTDFTFADNTLTLPTPDSGTTLSVPAGEKMTVVVTGTV